MVNLGPWFDHHDLIRIVSANLESRNTTRTTATFVAHSAMRSRDDLKCQRKGAMAAVQRIVPKTIPASAAKIRRTTTSKTTSAVVR